MPDLSLDLQPHSTRKGLLKLANESFSLGLPRLNLLPLRGVSVSRCHKQALSRRAEREVPGRLQRSLACLRAPRHQETLIRCHLDTAGSNPPWDCLGLLRSVNGFRARDHVRQASTARFLRTPCAYLACTIVRCMRDLTFPHTFGLDSLSSPRYLSSTLASSSSEVIQTSHLFPPSRHSLFDNVLAIPPGLVLDLITCKFNYSTFDIRSRPIIRAFNDILHISTARMLTLPRSIHRFHDVTREQVHSRASVLQMFHFSPTITLQPESCAASNTVICICICFPRSFAFSDKHACSRNAPQSVAMNIEEDHRCMAERKCGLSLTCPLKGHAAQNYSFPSTFE
ncbi:hypothetical protein E4T56_gene3492 [Termitomyces sp. T112]|nr:hypothetical protein E4T56_gene3492 [Termitomyces sp. T112]